MYPMKHMGNRSPNWSWQDPLPKEEMKHEKKLHGVSDSDGGSIVLHGSDDISGWFSKKMNAFFHWGVFWRYMMISIAIISELVVLENLYFPLVTTGYSRDYTVYSIQYVV